jgi:hypothetical protein
MACIYHHLPGTSKYELISLNLLAIFSITHWRIPEIWTLACILLSCLFLAVLLQRSNLLAVNTCCATGYKLSE